MYFRALYSDQATVKLEYKGQPRHEIPSGVTHLYILDASVDKIADDTFCDFLELEEVKFHGFKTTIGKHAFSKCYKLISPVFPAGSTIKIEQFAFSGCKSLVEMDLRSVNIQDIGTGAFASCSSLKHAHLPEEGLMSISDRLFEDCCSLEEITVPSSIVVIGKSAFERCYDLKKVILPRSNNDDGETRSGSRLEIIGDAAFKRCAKLEDFWFPPTVVTIGKMSFMEARALKHLVLPEGLQWLGIGAFQGCTGLRYVSIPGTLSKVERSSFFSCRFLVEVDFQEGLEMIGEGAFENTNLSAIALPRSLRLIAKSAFFSCQNLVGVEIPIIADLRIMPGTKQCFGYCERLINVCIPTNMSRSADLAFERSYGLFFPDPRGDSSFVFCPEKLRKRFVHLPVHEVCYYASSMTIDGLSLALESSSGRRGAQFSSTCTDAFGMTPFHIVATSAKLDGAMLELLLKQHLAMDSICIKDKNDRTMMDYLLRHGSKRAVPLIKMVLQKVVQHETGGGDKGHPWFSRLSRSIQEIPCDYDSTKVRKKHVDSVMGQLTRYLGMESTCTVELAIWNLAIHKLPPEEQENQVARSACRTRCGSQIVLGHVMSYLWDYKDEVPVFVQSLGSSLYEDAKVTSTLVADDDRDIWM